MRNFSSLIYMIKLKLIPGPAIYAWTIFSEPRFPTCSHPSTLIFSSGFRGFM